MENQNDWEYLCKECSDLMKKYNITDEEIDSIVEKVKSTLNKENQEQILDLEKQRLDETFGLSKKLSDLKSTLKSFYKVYDKRIKRLKKKLIDTRDTTKDLKIINPGYYAGWSRGYIEGRASALKEVLEDLSNLIGKEEKK